MASDGKVISHKHKDYQCDVNVTVKVNIRMQMLTALYFGKAASWPLNMLAGNW
jgi:hypothetical protein